MFYKAVGEAMHGTRKLQRSLSVIRETLLTLLTYSYGRNTLAGTYMYEPVNDNAILGR